MDRMNDHPPDETSPDQQRLDALLGRYVNESIPTVPGNLESRVWREIRARREHEQKNRGSDWLTLILSLWRQPRMAFAGVAAAAAIGVSMSWATATTAHATSTQQALDLGVFSMESPSLPSTLLARAKARP